MPREDDDLNFFPALLAPEGHAQAALERGIPREAAPGHAGVP